MCTNFPYDVAAAALIVEEAGGVVTHADGRSLDDHPAVGSSRSQGWRCSAPRAGSCTGSCSRRSTGDRAAPDRERPVTPCSSEPGRAI